LTFGSTQLIMVLTWDMIYLKAFCLLIVIVGNHEQSERTLFVNGLEMRDQNDESFCDDDEMSHGGV
jgi:hypothetical protein